MDTQTMMPILSGCCGGTYVQYGPSDMVHCSECMNAVSVTADIRPNMDEGERIVTDAHPSGVSVLGYVTAGE